MSETHLGYDGHWQQPMRNTLPPLTFVQESLTALAGNVRLGIEGSNASVPGDDKYHDNSGNILQLPPLDRYGEPSRWIDVFSSGVADECEWKAAVSEAWVKLSSYEGIVGVGGQDTRILVSVEWDQVPGDSPDEVIASINVTTPCRAWDKSRYGYDEPVIELPVHTRTIPMSFIEGFVESDGYIAIEGPHYQKAVDASYGVASYHTFEDYGRTLGGVGLWPLDLDKLSVDEAPTLEYEMYIFTNDTMANVTLFISPSHNYLTQANALEYAIALSPAGDDTSPDYEMVQPVGPPEVDSMPVGWDSAVADAVWGVHTNTTTTGFEIGDPGAYTLRIRTLLPSLIIQKIVVDLGGVRESYLGPTESFLVGRAGAGGGNQTGLVR